MKKHENNHTSNKVIALGCRLNTFEAELIKKNAQEAGLENTIIVNTCTVTQEAHRQSTQMVRKLKKENPDAKIIVTGCAVEVDAFSYADMPEVSKVIGNKDKLNKEAFISQDKVIVNDINKNDDTDTSYNIPIIQGFDNKTRAFLQIQQGCDHRCSFCIIHKARGSSRSVDENNIIAQVKQLLKFGHKEIVLTGVDISSWERSALLNEPSKIGYLCKEILKQVPQLPRLRLSSLDPAVEDNDILDLLKSEPRFMPHIHLSLQSMNDTVLRNMGRRHSKQSASNWIEKLKQANSNIAIGADIIAGFPKETQDQHLDTLKTLKDLAIPFLHVFPYSERAGTAAAKMKPTDVSIRKQRCAEIISQGSLVKEDFFKNKIGKVYSVLVEAKNNGYTEDYSMVKILGEDIPSKTIIPVKITDFNTNNLVAKSVNKIIS